MSSWVLLNDNDDDADDDKFDDTLGEILGASSRGTTSLDLDLAVGNVNSNVDLACTPLLSPLSPLPPPPSPHLSSSLCSAIWGHLTRCCQFDDGTRQLAEITYKDALEKHSCLDMEDLQFEAEFLT